MSHQSLMSENPPTDNGNQGGQYQRKDKSPWFFLDAVDEVHAEERGYQRGEHHDDGDRRERSDDGVHVVVDNALIGVHRRLQDVAVDVGGLAGLCHLDVHVLNEVGVQFVNLQFELQFRQQRLIASDGGLEIGQRVLQARESDEALVVHLAVEVSLGLVDEHVNLFQPLQIPDG